MNQPQPFLRFTDTNLFPFAVGLDAGLNLPKTARIKEIEAQEGNAFTAYPFGYYQDGPNWVSRFANDNDWQATGPCQLARIKKIRPLTGNEQRGVNYLKAVISVIGDSDTATIITTNAISIIPAGLPYTVTGQDYLPDYFEIILNAGLQGSRDLHLLGEKQSGQWKVQMFIAFQPSAITDLYQIYIDAFNSALPLEVDGNGFTYQADFLDLDFCDFSPEPLQEYFLPAIQGDVFQVNIPVTGTNLPESADLSAALIDCNGNEILMQSEIVWPESICTTQYQASFIIPFTLPDGTYKIGLYDNYTGAFYCFSNIIQVDSTDQFSQMIQFQGNNIAEGFEYVNDWFQQIRFGINGAGPEFENQVSVYRDSEGNSRSTSVKTDLIVNLHTNWIDDQALKALQSATNHRTFNIGNQSYYITDFEVSHNQDFSTITSYFGLCQVKLKAKKQNYQPINQGCVNC